MQNDLPEKEEALVKIGFAADENFYEIFYGDDCGMAGFPEEKAKYLELGFGRRGRERGAGAPCVAHVVCECKTVYGELLD
jgi:hypothetical protein